MTDILNVTYKTILSVLACVHNFISALLPTFDIRYLLKWFLSFCVLCELQKDVRMSFTSYDVLFFVYVSIFVLFYLVFQKAIKLLLKTLLPVKNSQNNQNSS